MNTEQNNLAKAQSSVSKFMSKYLAFVGMFVGAGFISGSIVHLGEGINPWDVSVLVVGVLFFLISTCVQEFVFNKKDYKQAGVVSFILYSIILSIGVGMASGGFQHYVDTPEYSAYLIPIGLGLGLIAFLLKEQARLSFVTWLKYFVSIIVFVVVSIWGLNALIQHIPETLLQGQGHSHGGHTTDDIHVESVTSDIQDDDHNHSSHTH